MRYSIFTKPYKDTPPALLGEKVRGMGFDAIEFPLRPGYQVEPEDAERELPKLSDTLKNCGVAISSVAGPTDEVCFAGCAAAGIKIIRIMATVDAGVRYLEWEKRYKEYLAGLIPLCERYGVTVGIQNHSGRYVAATMELYRLIEDFDPHIAAVWDAGHSGLMGEEPEQALDIIYDRMCLINFKNAYYRRTNGYEAKRAAWLRQFTVGRQGLADFPRITAYLKDRGYSRDICLPAEYTEEPEYDGDPLIDTLACEDLAYVKSLME